MKAIPARRLEDRIRELCKRLTSGADREFDELIAELQLTMTEYSLRLHNKTTATVLAWPDFPGERRRA